MHHHYHKKDFPVGGVRRFLEPGPIVLVTSAFQRERNVMTLGWQTVIEFSPSLVVLMISAGNHSHRLIRDSGACVINLPTADMIDTVVGIGNTSGTEIDKFEHFSLRTEDAKTTEAPLLPTVLPISNAGLRTTGLSAISTCSSSKWSGRMWRTGRPIRRRSTIPATASS